MKGRPTCNDFLRAYADPDNPPSPEDLKRLFLTDEEEQAGYPAPASRAWKWLVEWFGDTAIVIVIVLLYLAGVVGYGIGYHESKAPTMTAEDRRQLAGFVLETDSLRKTIEELEFELAKQPRLLDEETVRIEELLCRHRYEENQVDSDIFEVLQLHCEQPQQGEKRGRR